MLLMTLRPDFRLQVPSRLLFREAQSLQAFCASWIELHLDSPLEDSK